MEEETLFLQLHKLTAFISNARNETTNATESNEASTLEQLFQTLWETRKTGLKPLQKSYFLSLLHLPSLHDLDPVLASLRSLIRKAVHGNISGDNIQKLFPIDLPLELQSILLMLLQKYQNQWREEALRDQPQWQKTRISEQVKVSAPLLQEPVLTPDMSSLMWPRQDNGTNRYSHNDLCAPAQITADTDSPHMAPVSIQEDDALPENLATLPRLKSMTWTMENRNLAPAKRVAVINLKLHDCTKDPCGELEVKFQLNKDTLEAMLRSLTYINEQLSNNVEPASGPLQKKRRQ